MPLLDLTRFSGEISQSVQTPNLGPSADAIVWREIAQQTGQLGNQLLNMYSKQITIRRENESQDASERFSINTQQEFENMGKRVGPSGRILDDEGNETEVTFTQHMDQFIKDSLDEERQKLSDSTSKRYFEAMTNNQATDFRVKSGLFESQQVGKFAENSYIEAARNGAIEVQRAAPLNVVASAEDQLLKLNLRGETLKKSVSEYAYKTLQQKSYSDIAKNAGDTLVLQAAETPGMTADAVKYFGSTIEFKSFEEFDKYVRNYAPDFLEGKDEKEMKAFLQDIYQTTSDNMEVAKGKVALSNYVQPEVRLSQYKQLLNIKWNKRKADNTSLNNKWQDWIKSSGTKGMSNKLMEHANSGQVLVQESLANKMDPYNIVDNIYSAAKEIVQSDLQYNKLRYNRKQILSSDKGINTVAEKLAVNMGIKKQFDEIKSRYPRIGQSSAQELRNYSIKAVESLNRNMDKDPLGTIAAIDSNTRNLRDRLVRMDPKTGLPVYGTIADYSAYSDEVNKILSIHNQPLHKQGSLFDTNTERAFFNYFNSLDPKDKVIELGKMDSLGKSGKARIISHAIDKGLVDEQSALLMTSQFFGQNVDLNNKLSGMLLDINSRKNFGNVKDLSLALGKDEKATNEELNKLDKKILQDETLNSLKKVAQQTGATNTNKMFQYHAKNLKNLSIFFMQEQGMDSESALNQASRIYLAERINPYIGSNLKVNTLSFYTNKDMATADKASGMRIQAFKNKLEEGNIQLDIDSIPALKKALDAQGIKYDEGNYYLNRKSIISEFNKMAPELFFSADSYDGTADTFFLKYRRGSDIGNIILKNKSDNPEPYSSNVSLDFLINDPTLPTGKSVQEIEKEMEKSPFYRSGLLQGIK
jgi:hypothetical protein